jgi:hypothetical protein
MLVVIMTVSFTGDKYFGLNDLGQRGLERSETRGREDEASSIATPTVRTSCFHGLSAAVVKLLLVES